MDSCYDAIVPLSKVGLSPSYGSILPLDDSRLLWVWGTGSAKEPRSALQSNRSIDGGRTWSDPTPLRLESGEALQGVYETSLLRLPSGALGLVQHERAGQLTFHVSTDEGATWSAGTAVNPPGSVAYAQHDHCLVLSSGRIVVPAYAYIGPTPAGEPKRTDRFGQTFTNADRSRLNYA